MPKIVGTRERVHQPFYDSLIRTDGSVDLRSTNQGMFGAVPNRAQLFVRQGADISVSNLTTGGFFPSDQTYITLAVRVWTYFRFNPEAPVTVQRGLPEPIGTIPGAPRDRVMRVHKLYHQTQNQFFWQMVAGDKPQLTTFTAYTPMAGGLDGYFAGNGVARPGAAGAIQNDPFLGPAAQFIVLGSAGVTNVVAAGTTIGGNIGVGPTSPTITGFPPGVVTGFVDADGLATAAQTYLSAVAVPALNALSGTNTGAAELGGLTFAPGVYFHGASSLTAGAGVLTLNGGGNPNATFVFQLGAFTVGPAAQIVLVNGARAHNVYFTSTGAITVNTTASMQGNLIAATTVTFAHAATLTGRAFAQSASVTFDDNQLQLDPFDPAAPGAATDSGFGGANGNSLPRANNGVPTSSALMRLARPILIPPRQGFQVVAIASPTGQTTGSSVIEQLNGLVPNNSPNAIISGSGLTTGFGTGTGLSVPGEDDIEKDVKYILDGIHSRDVL